MKREPTVWENIFANDTFHRYRANISEIHMEPEMTMNSCSNFEEEEQTRRNQNT